MRAAPAVSVHGSGGLPWRLTRTALPAAAFAAVSIWLLQRLPGLPPATLAVLVVAATAAAAAVAWRLARPAAATLGFDGQRWTCDGAAGEPAVMLDLDRFLLLRWQASGTGAPRWLAFTAAESRGAFHGLRVALYAPRPVAARISET